MLDSKLNLADACVKCGASRMILRKGLAPGRCESDDARYWSRLSAWFVLRKSMRGVAFITGLPVNPRDARVCA